MSTLFRLNCNGVYIHHMRDESPRVEDFPMHAHTTHELYYFIAGKGSYSVEASTYHLYPGCVMVMRAGETHHLHIDPTSPYERVTINFQPGLFHPIDPENRLTAAFVERPSGQRNLYEPDMLNTDLIHACLNTLALQGRAASEEQKRLLTISRLCPVLFEIYQCFSAEINRPLPRQSGPEDIAGQLVQYINSHLCEDLSLDALAEHFFTSKIHLNKQFKQVTGSTIWEYTIIKRLLLARQYIQDGMPAGEAAEACGWKDYSSFYRSYKTRFHVSPAADYPRKKQKRAGKM